MLLVAASMDQELAGLRRELAERETVTGRDLPVEFRVLGVGPQKAGAAMDRLLSAGGFDEVLLLGVAGALAPGLETGDLLLAGEYALDSPPEQGNPEGLVKPGSELVQRAELAAAEIGMPVNTGGTLTVDHLVTGPEERLALAQRYGAYSVNMEDYTVAQAAQKAGTPFLSVRVVLDTAGQRLPGYLPGLASSRYNVLTKVLAMPWRVPTLLKLKSQLQLCQAVLTRFGMAYLDQMPIRTANESATSHQASRPTSRPTSRLEDSGERIY